MCFRCPIQRLGAQTIGGSEVSLPHHAHASACPLFDTQGSFCHLPSSLHPAASCHVMFQYQAEVTCGLGRILEEEDNLIAAHRWQIEETMAIVRQEMTLLGQVAPLCPSS